MEKSSKATFRISGKSHLCPNSFLPVWSTRYSEFNMNRSVCVAFESIGDVSYDYVNMGKVNLLKCTGDHFMMVFYSYKTLHSTRGANLLLSAWPLVHN